MKYNMAYHPTGITASDRDNLDVIDDLSGNGGKSLQVKGDESGLEWSADATSAPADAQYLVTSANATLTNEVVVTGLETISGIMKGDGAGAVSAAVAGTDYSTPSSTDTLTNKTFDANGTGNSLSNVEVADLALSAISSASDINTGTSTTKLNTPDALAGSNIGTKSFCIVPFESDAAVTTGDGKVAFTVPASMNGMNLINVVASVHTKGVTGTTDK
jgi:hypothetical protein